MLNRRSFGLISAAGITSAVLGIPLVNVVKKRYFTKCDLRCMVVSGYDRNVMVCDSMGGPLELTDIVLDYLPEGCMDVLVSSNVYYSHNNDLRLKREDPLINIHCCEELNSGGELNKFYLEELGGLLPKGKKELVLFFTPGKRRLTEDLTQWKEMAKTYNAETTIDNVVFNGEVLLVAV